MIEQEKLLTRAKIMKSKKTSFYLMTNCGYSKDHFVENTYGDNNGDYVNLRCLLFALQYEEQKSALSKGEFPFVHYKNSF